MIRNFQNKAPKIASSAYVDEAATIIGDVTIGEDCSIWPGVVLRGDIHSITIGHGSNIQDNTVVHVTRPSEHNPNGFPVKVGRYVTVGHNVTLHACTIEDHVLIGMGSVILDGAIIETNVLLAAGSLVPPNKSLTSGYLWMGSPVKAIRELTEEEFVHLNQSPQDYIDLKNDYLNQR